MEKLVLIIWDEYKYGEYVCANQVTTAKWQYKELKCVVKYMLENGHRLKDIRDRLGVCCQEGLKYLYEEQRIKIFNRIIQQARRENIVKNKKITVYESEIEIIKSLENINLEKTIFILLIYSKWLDNIEWFALMRADIYKEAKLGKLNSVNKQKLLTELCSSGLLVSDVKRVKSGRSKDKSQMWNIPFLQDSGEIAFEFDNYINVVYRYLNYVYGGFFECNGCGGMFEKNSPNKTSCNECAKIKRREYNKLKKREYRGGTCPQVENAQNPDE